MGHCIWMSAAEREKPVLPPIRRMEGRIPHMTFVHTAAHGELADERPEIGGKEQDRGRQDRRRRHGRGDKCLSGLGLSRHAGNGSRAVASCKWLSALAFVRAVRAGARPTSPSSAIAWRSLPFGCRVDGTRHGRDVDVTKRHCASASLPCSRHVSLQRGVVCAADLATHRAGTNGVAGRLSRVGIPGHPARCVKSAPPQPDHPVRGCHPGRAGDGDDGCRLREDDLRQRRGNAGLRAVERRVGGVVTARVVRGRVTPAQCVQPQRKVEFSARPPSSLAGDMESQVHCHAGDGGKICPRLPSLVLGHAAMRADDPLRQRCSGLPAGNGQEGGFGSDLTAVGHRRRQDAGHG